MALNFECINVISQYHSEKYFVRWPIAVGSTPPALFSMSSARILLTNPGKLFFFSESEFLQLTVIEKKKFLIRIIFYWTIWLLNVQNCQLYERQRFLWGGRLMVSYLYERIRCVVKNNRWRNGSKMIICYRGSNELPSITSSRTWGRKRMSTASLPFQSVTNWAGWRSHWDEPVRSIGLPRWARLMLVFVRNISQNLKWNHISHMYRDIEEATIQWWMGSKSVL